MRPTENFLLFLPCGNGVEGGSGQFFRCFCENALAYYCLRRFLKKSLENLLPGAALSTLCARHTVLNMRSRGCTFRLFFAKLLCRYATAGSIHFAFLRLGMIFPDAVFCYFMPVRKKRNRKTERSSVLQMFGCFVSRKESRPTGAHFFLSESWSFSLTSSSISVRRVLMSLNWRCTEA